VNKIKKKIKVKKYFILNNKIKKNKKERKRKKTKMSNKKC
jgi:hypothetical protein